MGDANMTTYRSLEDIRTRREAILKDIQADNKQIKTLWESLFHKADTSTALTPSRKFSTLMNVGAGFFDAAILGWKLYRKFGNKSSSRKTRRW